MRTQLIIDVLNETFNSDEFIQNYESGDGTLADEDILYAAVENDLKARRMLDKAKYVTFFKNHVEIRLGKRSSRPDLVVKTKGVTKKRERIGRSAPKKKKSKLRALFSRS